MRYIYKQPPASVPPPKELAPPIPSTPIDTLQDLIQRRADAEKNRLMFHLTEADCNLICSNATELRFTNGQVIATEGEVIQAMYRIKSGKISLMMGSVKLYDLPQGYFIGEGLFIRGDAEDVYGCTLLANGPVVLSEVNLPFVRQLLNVDKVLAFKIYRHIANKLSSLLFSMVTKVFKEGSAAPYFDRTRSDSLSSTGSDSSSSSSLSSLSSSGSSNSTSDLDYPPKAVIMSGDMVSTRPLRKKVVKKNKKAKAVAFKTYDLYESTAGGQAALYSTKLVVTLGCKITGRRKIKYNKILDMAKTGKNSVTIIYGVQAKTLFFKDDTELNQFHSLVQSLIVSNDKQQIPSTPITTTSPISVATGSPTPKRPNPLAQSMSDPDTHAADKQFLMNLAVRQDLVKGDVVIAEGDLYQRIYTVASGQLHMKSGDKTFVKIEEGETFGVLTLFHLRPSLISIEVASDTATLLIIPNYKIHELITTHFHLAVRMHKKAAQLVYGQIERILMSREGLVKGFDNAGVLL